jgi:hypothetical protein
VTRPLGHPAAERERRECERWLVGKEIALSEREWVVRVVDHLHGTADLVDQWSVYDQLRSPFALRNVPLADVVGADGCSCGQHLGGAR